MHQWTVERNEPAGTGLRRLRFRDAPAGYHTPGQYVLAGAPGGEPGFFAIASSPGEPLELLVKREGAIGVAVADTPAGERLNVSDAQGPGFALDRAAGHELVVLVNGSGISAARPVIRAAIAAGLPDPVSLYYGVLTPDRRAFLWDLEAWANAGVTVHTVVGTPDGTGWDGHVGFVQDVAESHGKLHADVAAVLVGVPPMIADATARLLAAGCPEDRILLNF